MRLSKECVFRENFENTYKPHKKNKMLVIIIPSYVIEVPFQKVEDVH